MNWKPGDIAICINNGLLESNTTIDQIPQLRLKAQYIVNKVKTCECGQISLDVGLVSPDLKRGVTCKCGAISAPIGIHWAAAERFVKPKTDEAIEEDSNLEEQMNSAIKEGNQERIDSLLDQMSK